MNIPSHLVCIVARVTRDADCKQLTVYCVSLRQIVEPVTNVDNEWQMSRVVEVG